MLPLAVLGSKASGKTTVAEHLVSGLTRMGYKVVAIKHIHHEFTVDTKGKDTWRFSDAGARAVVGVSPNEIFFIKRPHNPPRTLQGLLRLFHGEDSDVAVLEGFHDIVGKSREVPKVITAKSRSELQRILRDTEPPILAVTGIIGKMEEKGLDSDLPVIDLEKEEGRLLKIVRAAIAQSPLLRA